MKTFAEHFCLKDGRDNFEINEQRDWQLILGTKKYKKTVDEMLDAAIASRRPPRLVWVGDYGVGKTHHINYASNKITEGDLPFKVVRMELPDVQDNSEFNVLFERMVNEIGFTYFRKLLTAQINADNLWLDTVTPSDVKKALRQMALNEDVADSAWDFLCGRRLGKDQKAQVGVSKVQLADSEEYASVIHNIAEIIKARTEDRRILLFLVDEVEGLRAVSKANAVNKWVLAVRKILDIKEIGAIFAVGAQSLNEIPSILQDGAVIRRFGQQNYVYLENYDTSDTKSFISQLLATFIDPEKKALLETREALESKANYDSALYPFTADGFEGYCQWLVSEQQRAKPAEFLTKLHATLGAALKDAKILVDRAFLENRGEWQ